MLEPELLADLSEAALDNAGRLLDDAQHLVAAKRYPTAHALATIAYEEIGKHVITTSAISRLLVDPNYEPTFRRRFRDHHAKLRMARHMANALAATDMEDALALMGRLDQLARDDHATKLRGLYVDVGSRSALRPSDAIHKDLAVEMVRTVRFLLDAIRSFHRSDPMAAAEAGRRVARQGIPTDPEEVFRTGLVLGDLFREMTQKARPARRAKK